MRLDHHPLLMNRHWMDKLLLILVVLLLPARGMAEDRTIPLPDGKQVILHDDFTWEYYQAPKNEIDASGLQDGQTPPFLRRGIQADKATLSAAVELYSQGWRFTMPRPKSAQAAWGNYDRRTTWWYGYWECGFHKL